MRRKRILVVEDERDLADLLVFSLEASGFRVEHAPDGQAAWDFLCQSSPDLVLTDLMMPVMDGCELVERMRGSPPLAAIPVLVLSALPEGMVQSKCQSADVFLRKPFQLEQLLDQVSKLLEPQGQNKPRHHGRGLSTASDR